MIYEGLLRLQLILSKITTVIVVLRNRKKTIKVCLIW